MYVVHDGFTKQLLLLIWLDNCPENNQPAYENVENAINVYSVQVWIMQTS